MLFNWDDVMELLSIGLVAGIGAYFGSYLKTKGKNLATREDVDGVVEEVKRVTRTTEEIKADISKGVWDRQKYWELKRDILYEVAQKAGIRMAALTKLYGVHTTDKATKARGENVEIHRRLEALREFNAASAEFEGMVFIVSATCGIELVRAFGDFGLLLHRISSDISDEKPEALDEASDELGRKSSGLSAAIRKQLGIDVISQSNRAGATP